MPEPQPRSYSDEEVAKLIALQRRALSRLAVIEERLAHIERRLHDLDDLAETMQGLQRLVDRSGKGMNETKVRDIVNATMDKRLTKKGKAIGRDLGDEFE